MPEIKRPLRFRPYYKSVLWGGTRIGDLKHERIGCDTVGESWELSAMEGCESVAIDGEFAGKTLSALAAEYGAALLGTKVTEKYGSQFPLLIKFIDAHHDLSVQVHPNDALAMERHNAMGKSEMWYVLAADPGAKIHSGLRAPLDPEQYEHRIAEKSIMDVVGEHDAAVGQFYYIPAGTLHSIGSGCLVAEIQQSSDLTYRVYDFDRVDANGNTRPLHTTQAKDAIDYSYPNNITPTGAIFTDSKKEAVTSPYFKIDYHVVSDDAPCRIVSDGSTFHAVVVVDGSATVCGIKIGAGSTLLLPADLPEAIITGSARILTAYI